MCICGTTLGSSAFNDLSNICGTETTHLFKLTKGSNVDWSSADSSSFNGCWDRFGLLFSEFCDPCEPASNEKVAWMNGRAQKKKMTNIERTWLTFPWIVETGITRTGTRAGSFEKLLIFRRWRWCVALWFTAEILTWTRTEIGILAAVETGCGLIFWRRWQCWILLIEDIHNFAGNVDEIVQMLLSTIDAEKAFSRTRYRIQMRMKLNVCSVLGLIGVTETRTVEEAPIR